MTTAEEFIRIVGDIYQGAVAMSVWDSAAPARVHLGQGAFDLLKAVAPYPVPEGQVISQIFGIPVVVGSLNSALPLDDLGYRVFNRNDDVIASGVLKP